MTCIGKRAPHWNYNTLLSTVPEQIEHQIPNTTKKQTKTCNSVNVNDWHRRIPLMNSSNVTLGLPSNKEWNQNELFQMMCPSINTLTVPTLQLKSKITPNGNKRSRDHKRRTAAVRLHHLHYQGCETAPFPRAHLPYAGPASIFWSF